MLYQPICPAMPQRRQATVALSTTATWAVHAGGDSILTVTPGGVIVAGWFRGGIEPVPHLDGQIRRRVGDHMQCGSAAAASDRSTGRPAAPAAARRHPALAGSTGSRWRPTNSSTSSPSSGRRGCSGLARRAFFDPVRREWYPESAGPLRDLISHGEDAVVR